MLLVTALSFVFPKDKEKYLGELFWTRKTFAPAKYNIVLMGDSRIYRGLSPNRIERYIPETKVLNFAYSNGGLNPTMFKAAAKKLAQNKPIKVIVLGVSANTITNYSAENIQYIQELNLPREKIFERLYLNPVRYWFSATTPEELRDHFNKKENKTYYRNKFYMNGYVASEKFPADTMEALQGYIKDFTNYKVSDQNLKLLFDQVNNWTMNGIKVIGFRPPVPAPMRALEDTLGLYNENIIEQGIKQAGGYWIHIDPNRYITYDGSHLTIESAQRLSENIAVEIKHLLSVNEKQR